MYIYIYNLALKKLNLIQQDFHNLIPCYENQTTTQCHDVFYEFLHLKCDNMAQYVEIYITEQTFRLLLVGVRTTRHE